MFMEVSRGHDHILYGMILTIETMIQAVLQFLQSFRDKEVL